MNERKMYELNIEARDVLFFRGAKPMGGSAVGEGGHWPMPSVFHHAMLGTLHAQWPERQHWEHKHAHGKDKNPKSSFRFGDLQTVGLFPEKNATLYLPTPSDIQCKNNVGELCILQPHKLTGEGDLPTPLEYGLTPPVDALPTKQTPPKWISLENLKKYLNRTLPENSWKNPELYDIEQRAGIGMDPLRGTADTGTDDQAGKFYLAEYLRLHDGVRLKALASCYQKRLADQQHEDLIKRFYDDAPESTLVLGGERGAAFLQIEPIQKPAWSIPKPSGRLIKWVLLTPAQFLGGWRPGWIDEESGSVKAKQYSERTPGETRQAWRTRLNAAQEIPGKLIAASIPKPIPYSGWRAHGGHGKTGAKPTRLCVPAGAVYYFEVPEGQDPQPLIDFLHEQTKSDWAAEKGFGFGVCGVWEKTTN